MYSRNCGQFCANRLWGGKMTWILCMVFAVLSWSGAFIAGKIGVKSASPLALTYFRFLIAVICVFGYAKISGISLKINRKDWSIMFILGFVGMVCYHILFFESLRYTTAIKTSMIAATNPLITAVIAARMLGEKLNPIKIICIFSALFGVLLTISQWDLLGLIQNSINIGDVIMLCAVLCWSGYAVIVRTQVGRFHPVVTTFYSFLTCVLILTPFQAAEIIAGSFHIEPDGWLAIIYMGLFPTFLGYMIQQQSIKHLGLSQTALFVNLTPVFTMVLAVYILNEQFFVLNAVSAAIIIAAVLGYSIYGNQLGKSKC